jgi:hypothetical protein
MPLNESIDGLSTGTYTVTRRAASAFTDGIYPGGGSASTFSIAAVVEPATGLQRVVGGYEMRSDNDGQRTNDIQVIYTRTELYTRRPTHEADLVTIGGRQFTVFRVESWNLSGEVHYRALATLKTSGAS